MSLTDYSHSDATQAATIAPSPQAPGESVAAPSAARPTEAQRLLALLSAVEYDLFRSEEGDLFVQYPVGDYRPTSSLKSAGAFTRWLADHYFTMTGRAVSSRTLGEVRMVLEARALAMRPVPVYTRVGALGDVIYLDLGDETWRAIEIDFTGWRLVADPPVRFRRGKGMLPLPTPLRGGSLDLLQHFVNVPDEAAWRLIVGWVVMLLHPTGPYPQLVLRQSR